MSATPDEITDLQESDALAKAGRKAKTKENIKNMLLGADTGDTGVEGGGAVAGLAEGSGSAFPEFTPVYSSARARRQDLYGD